MADIDIEAQKIENESHCTLMIILFIGWIVSNIMTAICQLSLAESCQSYEPAIQILDLMFVLGSIALLVIHRKE